MEATLTKSSNAKNGLLFGVIIGFTYCISLFLRYNMTSSNPIVIGVIALLFYLVVIGILFFCGIKRKKELGGYIDLKDAFQTIFIAVLVGELIYMVFNIVYLKFIDPHYFEKFITSMENWIEKSSMPDDQKEKTLDRIKSQMEKQQNGMNLQGFLKGYLISVAITGVCGFIAALIIRKKRPVFELDNQS